MFLTGTLNSSREMYNSLSVLTIVNIVVNWKQWAPTPFLAKNCHTLGDNDQKHHVRKVHKKQKLVNQSNTAGYDTTFFLEVSPKHLMMNNRLD